MDRTPRAVVDAACAAIPLDGWTVESEGRGRHDLRHPASPLHLTARRDGNAGPTGPLATVWGSLAPPRGDGHWRVLLADLPDLGEDVAVEIPRVLAEAYGRPGQAAARLLDILGTAWAAAASRGSTFVRVEIHRAGTPDGSLVLGGQDAERRRRLPGGRTGALTRTPDAHGRLRMSRPVDPAGVRTLSAHGRLTLLEEAKAMAAICRIAPEEIVRPLARDLARLGRGA